MNSLVYGQDQSAFVLCFQSFTLGAYSNGFSGSLEKMDKSSGKEMGEILLNISLDQQINDPIS